MKHQNPNVIHSNICIFNRCNPHPTIKTAIECILLHLNGKNCQFCSSTCIGTSFYLMTITCHLLSAHKTQMNFDVKWTACFLEGTHVQKLKEVSYPVNKMYTKIQLTDCWAILYFQHLLWIWWITSYLWTAICWTKTSEPPLSLQTGIPMGAIMPVATWNGMNEDWM